MTNPSGTAWRKKPVVIEAMQYQRPEFSNTKYVRAFEEWLEPLARAAGRWPVTYKGHSLIIPTLEGDHEAQPGDWIIRGVSGEIYPCKPDIFEKTYEPATNPSGTDLERPIAAVREAAVDASIRAYDCAGGECMHCWRAALEAYEEVIRSGTLVPAGPGGWRTDMENAPRDGRRLLLRKAIVYGRHPANEPPCVDGMGLFKWMELEDGWSTLGSGGWGDEWFRAWFDPQLLSSPDAPPSAPHEGDTTREAFNAGYCSGVERDASPEELDHAWKGYSAQSLGAKDE